MWKTTNSLQQLQGRSLSYVNVKIDRFNTRSLGLHVLNKMYRTYRPYRSSPGTTKRSSFSPTYSILYADAVSAQSQNCSTVQYVWSCESLFLLWTTYWLLYSTTLYMVLYCTLYTVRGSIQILCAGRSNLVQNLTPDSLTIMVGPKQLRMRGFHVATPRLSRPYSCM